MIPNDQPLRKQTIQRMLNKLIIDAVNENHSLTEWESDFIVSINEQFEAKGDLSSKQAEILERIYDK